MGHEMCGYCNHVPCICKKTKRIAEGQESPNSPFGPNFPTYEGKCPYPVEYDSTDAACPSWWRGEEHASIMWAERYKRVEIKHDQLILRIRYARQQCWTEESKNRLLAALDDKT